MKYIRFRVDGIEGSGVLIARDVDGLWAVKVFDITTQKALGTHRCHSGWRIPAIVEAFKNSTNGYWIEDDDIIKTEELTDAQ